MLIAEVDLTKVGGKPLTVSVVPTKEKMYLENQEYKSIKLPNERP